MERPALPESTQWAAIIGDVHAIGLLLGLDDNRTQLLLAHFNPTAPPSLDEAVIPVCRQLADTYGEWRARPVAASTTETESPAVVRARKERQAYEGAVMGRLLGGGQYRQPPQSLAQLLEGQGEGEKEQMLGAVDSVLSSIVTFRLQTSQLLAGGGTIPVASSEQTAPPTLELAHKALLGDVALTSLRAYMNTVHNHPYLTAAEEYALAVRIQHGTRRTATENAPARKRFTADALEARQQLAAHSLRLVARLGYSLLSQRQHLWSGMLDVIEEGNVALMRAIDKFDPRRGRLSTYAVPRILGEMRRWMSKEGFFLAGDERYRQRERKMIEGAYSAANTVGPTSYAAVARSLGFRRVAVEGALSEPDRITPELFTAVENAADEATLWHRIRGFRDAELLSDEQFAVLWQRYGLGKSTQEIATEGNKAHQGVNALERRALAQLRAAFEGAALPPKRYDTPEFFLQKFDIAPGRTPRAQAIALLGSVTKQSVRRVLELRYGLGESTEPMEITAIVTLLGITEGSVKQYIKAGVREIRAYLDEKT